VRAAERLAGPSVAARVDDAQHWTRPMVERAILVFDELDRLPPFDEDAIRGRVLDFLAFADRVALGGVADEAAPLARAFVERGYRWLADHPQLAPFTTPAWSALMVEEVIQWFSAATSGAPDAGASAEIGRRLRTFAAVVSTGAVESGDAASLAEAFLAHATHWVERHPHAKAAFEQQH